MHLFAFGHTSHSFTRHCGEFWLNATFENMVLVVSPLLGWQLGKQKETNCFRSPVPILRNDAHTCWVPKWEQPSPESQQSHNDCSHIYTVLLFLFQCLNNFAYIQRTETKTAGDTSRGPTSGNRSRHEDPEIPKREIKKIQPTSHKVKRPASSHPWLRPAKICHALWAAPACGPSHP